MTKWYFSGNARLFKHSKSTNVIYHTNKIKKKSQILTSRHRKIIWENLTVFHDKKPLKILELKGIFLNMKKRIYEKSTAKNMINGKILNIFLLRSGT